MLTYEEMQYFLAFAVLGTLSDVAEQYHISQPTITRAMKKAESDFGVPLFDRTKNSISLNDNGRLAADEIKNLLHQTDEVYRRVSAYDRANRTISIGSAAAVQLPGLIQKLSAANPEATISTELKKPDALIDGLNKNIFQLIILPYQPENPAWKWIKIGEEHLMFYLPKKHHFAKRKSLTMAEMNGENMLLFSEIGFWAEIVKEKMPDSRFLVQSERYSLEELIANSILPCFATDLSYGESPSNDENRVCVPIADHEVNVSYYLICKSENQRNFSGLF